MQNKLSLTQVLKEAHYKTQDEYEKFLEEAPQNDIQDDFHVIDAVTEGKEREMQDTKIEKHLLFNQIKLVLNTIPSSIKINIQ